MNPLIGRKEEIDLLNAYLKSEKSEFIAVYGRRRVGKTFLIRKVYENKIIFQLTGMANVNMAQQLSQFTSALNLRKPNWKVNPVKNWFEAFQQLIAFIDNKSSNEKKVIFLDELPWLDTKGSQFLSALEHFWNSYASARNDIILIVCGSAASWIINKLFKNKGGLHNRITGKIKLAPFTLKEVEAFLLSRNAIYNRYQVLILYMAFGGIPFYIDLIKSEKSVIQNINDLCFSQEAPFRIEFENLYASLFNKHENHIQVIRALSNKNKGLSRNEIIQITKLTNGGGLTRLLNELEESSFIRSYKAFGKKQNNKLYQLTDLYSLFYLKFIEKSARDDENFWINIVNTPTYFSWSGYAFEMVCLHHIYFIKKALGISGIQSAISTWQSSKAQIDLIIDRKDQVINLCEMKFSLNEFAIDNKYETNLRNKIETFRLQSKTKKALFLTFITSYGIKQNKHSGMVRNDLNMDIFFA